MPTSKSTSKSTTKRPSKPGQESPTRPFRGTFALLPPEATRWQCEGQCGRTLPRAKFPTTARGMHPLVGRVVSAPERRTAECRECRNERQGREERALERAAAAAAEAAAAEAKRAARREASKRAAATRAARSKLSSAAAAPPLSGTRGKQRSKG